MKKNKPKDERIIQINNKIQSEAFLLLLVLLGISLFVKSYLLDLPVSDSLAEFLILGAAVLYLLIRGALIGHEIIDTSKHAKILQAVSIVGGSLLVALVTGIRNYSLYQHLYSGYLDPHLLAVVGITFLSSVIFMAGLLFVVFSVNRLSQKRLENKIDDDLE
ncbi:MULTISPECIES: DUF6773 family protein [unclassified Enterococcus]|uniref:DUF6773 family protein n=1 Tax=unclassified Enterococcus TaxID=2608891 RepID=UPI001A9B4508|nr:DUF6773 family protein [Enterococcus sp. DIV1271a]MBO1299377.1 hypothetical protein [Enterococcus sp. DIV1271a]